MESNTNRQTSLEHDKGTISSGEDHREVIVGEGCLFFSLLLFRLLVGCFILLYFCRSVAVVYACPVLDSKKIIRTWDGGGGCNQTHAVSS